TIGSVPGNSGGTVAVGLYSYLIKPPREISGKTHYDFARSGLELSGMVRQIVAIDTDGRESTVQIIRSTGSLMSGEGELLVPLPTHQIKEIQYRRRPFDQWIRISNISLQPGKKPEVKTATSDDPPQ